MESDLTGAPFPDLVADVPTTVRTESTQRRPIHRRRPRRVPGYLRLRRSFIPPETRRALGRTNILSSSRHARLERMRMSNQVNGRSRLGNGQLIHQHNSSDMVESLQSIQAQLIGINSKMAAMVEDLLAYFRHVGFVPPSVTTQDR